MKSEQQYLDLFRGQRDLICQHSVAALNAVRDEAFASFERTGFPSLKEERYRYTDVARAFAPNYGVNLARKQFSVNPSEVFRCDVPNLSTSLAYVVNDQPVFSRPIPFVYTFSEAAEKVPSVLETYYNRLLSPSFSPLAIKRGDKGETEGLAFLNTAFAQDGLLIYVPKNQRMERTLQVVNLLHSPVDLLLFRRVLIVLEDGAEASLLFCDHAMDHSSFLTSQVIEIFCGTGSHLDMYEMEETHTSCHRFSNVFMQVGRDCTVSHNNITLYNGQTRNTIDAVLQGENAKITLNGCVIADKSQQVDNNTLIDHAVPRCTSRELYKYVVDDNAVGAFAGRVLVRPDAQKTSSQETNANLCASNDARMYTQPMLEIYADDVKCSHGSTIGKLDEMALFYMRQRGISEAEARMLLKFAFVGQVIDEIQLQPLRERLHYLVEKRFRGELNKCTGCALCK